MENICKINDTLRRIDTTRQFFVPAAIEKSRNRAGCGRIFSLRRIIYFYPLIYFNGRSEDDSVHRRRNSTNFGERALRRGVGLACRHRTTHRTAAPKHRRDRNAEKHSDKMPCSTTAVRTATVRQNEASHPQQKSGPAFSPKEGGGSTYPRNTARTKRLLPNEKSQSPRTTGRGCPTICRQPLRYGFPAATSPKSGVNGCGTSPHSIFRTRRR